MRIMALRARIALAVAFLALLTFFAAARSAAQAPERITVSPDGPIRKVTEAVERASPGATVVVKAGHYREPTVVVKKPMTIIGEGWPTMDGEDQREILIVAADDVTVRGMRFINTGTSQIEDRAALRVANSGGCLIEGNRFENTFFGIYLARVNGCRVVGNELSGRPGTEEYTGNGIHLWSVGDTEIANNHVRGHRDGIYFEFARNTTAERNVSEKNLRYGLHFMFSDDCHYLENTFRSNGAGVAVMYTNRVEMRGNRFEDNPGSAAYGLLLKEIKEPVLRGNLFARNTVALFADGASDIIAEGNRFLDNGWAVKLMASTAEGRFTANDFVNNTFDVATNSRRNRVEFSGNYYDGYRGYDLDRDGRGDVPHHPVRLFSLLVEQNAPLMILLRSAFVALLDRAEQLVPALTPETLVDSSPAMKPNTTAAPKLATRP